jgi:hypothetical protein|tara:strand:- start:762 stop:941 length:180 start_codon:yes stop_codon:yes gene_type:complete
MEIELTDVRSKEQIKATQEFALAYIKLCNVHNVDINYDWDNMILLVHSITGINYKGKRE